MIMVIISNSTKKESKDILCDLVDPNILGSASSFIHKGIFDWALMDMGPTNDYGVLLWMKIRGFSFDVGDMLSLSMNACSPS